MSNTTLLLEDLSFSGIKNSLKTFLQEQDQFTDFDFEGSNLAALLDLLAYNTQQQGYLLNMVFNEGFIDTAEVYDSVVSHAKELSYTPRSMTSASLTCNVTITPANDSPAYILIPANTTFTAAASNAAFTFRTVDPYVAYVTNPALNAYTVSNVKVYEGPVFTDVYTANWSDPTQEFVIQNANVDTSSLKVTVQVGTANNMYNRATSLLDYDANSQIFFVEATYNQKYKVLFGDNQIGKKPENGSSIFISYRVPRGDLANGVSRLSSGAIDGHSNVAITVTSNSAGGASKESIESIKYYAPRFFQARERAVTASDYETLLLTNFPEISAINVYGGEEMDPPQFGKVAISIDLEDADGVSEGREQIYYDFLRKRCPVTVEPLFVDPDFLNVKVVTEVNYNPVVSLLSPSQVEALVTNTINTFNNTNLVDFGVTLYLSKLMSDINDADSSFRSNQTRLYVQRTLDLVDNSSVYLTTFHNAIQEGTLDSTAFEYNDDTCYFDDANGNIRMYSIVAENQTILNSNAGTIDYTTGDIELNAVDIESINGLLTFTATPQNQDITTRQNTILQIDMDSLIVTTTTG